MVVGIFSKLLSESLLSLYPIFVKYINIPLFLQVWSRFLTYVLISLLFIDFRFIRENILKPDALLLSLITIAHVYTSYKGFQILESGVAYVLFYTYPLFILLLSGQSFQPWLLFSVLGVYLLSSTAPSSVTTEPLSSPDTPTSEDSASSVFKKRPNVKERFPYEGIVMMVFAALTEAMIYFWVRKIKTGNHWNHMFLSYGMGAVLFTLFFFREITSSTFSTAIFSVSMGINLVIGLLGYLLRFYAISALEPLLYSSLSYFGIFMSYVYGVGIGGDTITPLKIIGTLLVLLPGMFQLYSTSNAR